MCKNLAMRLHPDRPHRVAVLALDGVVAFELGLPHRFFRAEIDHCRYDFQVASIERLLEMYRLFEEEARACLEAGVVIPAFDYVLRCSHTFNVLDARGAIAVAERQSYIGRIRDLCKLCAEAWVAQQGANA